MEASSSPIVMIGGQRSNNTTPHQHHYYSTPEQPSSFLSTLSYLPSPSPQDASHHLPQHHARRSSLHHTGGNNLQYGGSGSKTSTPLHHLQNLPQNSRATPRSRGQSPSVNSLGAESNIMMNTSSLSPLNHHHHPISNLSHHPHMNIGHGHNHLHDDSQIHINCDNSSHSISPPNSNSNTTISCGSGNSTSANIGVPTSGSRSKGEDHHSHNHHPLHNNLRNSRNPMQNNNNNNINGSNKPSNNNNKEKEDYENYRNRNGGGSERTKNHKSSLRGKKSILEEDFPPPEKSNGGIQLQNTNKFKQRPPFINPNQEFLPICDALFNLISLAAYFCDCVFDVLTVYSWYKISVETEEDKIFELSAIQQQQRNRLAGATSGEIEEVGSSMPKELIWQWSLSGLIFIFFSCVLSQCLSFKWYRESERRGQMAPDGAQLTGPPAPCSSSILILMHVGALGVLWRYFKLFIPVDLRFVKNEVRDLCLLRLIHAFCQATPMLLLQLYLIWHEPSLETVSDLTKVSTALSLFSVCWALASFSKHIRRQNVHKLVLTWLGVIFQFFWRLGTVTSRFLALSLYAIAYQYWVFIVLFLHWFCMLLWLISPKNIFHGEKMSPLKKVSYSAIVAVVYTFCYINVQETNSRVKVIIYYTTMFFENSLLLGVWLIAVRYEDEIWFRKAVTYLVFLCFFGGLAFMALYYRYFHVKKLSYVYDAESSIYRNTSSIGGCSLMNDNGSMVATISGLGGDYETASVARGKSNGVIMAYTGSRSGGNNSHLINSNKKKTPTKFNSKNNAGDRRNNKTLSENEKKSNDENETGKRTGPPYTKTNGLHIHQPNVPGVFNCRFHPAIKRKKKKPTTFVPPPVVRSQTTNNNGASDSLSHSQTSSSLAASAPFQQQQMQKQGQSSSLNSPQNFDDTTRIMLNHDHDHHESLGNIVIRQSPREQIIHGDDLPYPHNEISSSSHQHHISSPPGHHHLVDYGSPQCGGVDVGGGGSSSLNAHYDLPEYDPTNNVGSNGSQSSTYGPIISGLYHHPNMHALMMAKSASSSSTGRMMMAPAPFWRRPLSLTMGSENEGSVSSRIDIQQKLQEKKQQQLAELREIEEEIKQGKLKRPELHEICPQPVNQRQPIPVEKKQPWFGEGNGGAAGAGDECPEMSSNAMHDLSQRPPMMIPSGDQVGIILDPHQYLMYHHVGQNPSGIVMDSASGFYYNPDWPPSSNGNYYEPLYENGADSEVRGEGDTSPPSEGVSGGDGFKGRFGRRRHHNRAGYFDPSSRESIYKSYRIPSDIDSQMSLPRSYTLPREFKYKRKFRKPVKTENFLPSTNSSDGDVDSGEDPDAYSEVHPYPLPLPSMHHIQNETSGTPPQQSSSSGEVMGALTPAAAALGSVPAATRQSRKIPNGRPRHKLHETKL